LPARHKSRRRYRRQARVTGLGDGVRAHPNAARLLQDWLISEEDAPFAGRKP
jgi:hypothetical protein